MCWFFELVLKPDFEQSLITVVWLFEEVQNKFSDSTQAEVYLLLLL